MITLAVGMEEGHLLPPYDPDFDLLKINSLKRELAIKEKRGLVIKCKSEEDALDQLFILINSCVSSLSVIGSYTEGCVAATISNALRLGLEVFSPELLLFPKHKDSQLRESIEQYVEYGYFLGNRRIRSKITSYCYGFRFGIHQFNPV